MNFSEEKEKMMNTLERRRRNHSKLLVLLLTALTFIFLGGVERVHAQWSSPNTSGNTNYPNGNVGIGTTEPESLLHLAGPNGASTITFNTPGTHKFRLQTIPGILNWGAMTLNAKYNAGWYLDDTTTNGWFFKLDTRSGSNGQLNGLWLYRVPAGQNPHTDETPMFGVSSDQAYFASNVGIGTVNPGGKLQVGDGTGNITLRVVDSTGTIALGSQGGFMRMQTDGTNILFLNTGNAFAPVKASEGKFEGTGDSYFTGKVGIGVTNPTVKLDVQGDIHLSGSINAKYQDVAEWVPATHILPTGTVVVLNPAKSNEVMASEKPYDTRVAGVVSERPGLALGEAGEDKVLVATTGRVKVMVDASRAPIHIGDLLVTSDDVGVAMKSEPLNLGGAQIHRPGTLIGKALETLESGKAQILVLLSLQ
jgi:hypothetical protein